MYRTLLAGAVALAGITLAACSSVSSGTATPADHAAAGTSRPANVHSAGSANTHTSGNGAKDANSWCGEIEGADASMLSGRVNPNAPISPQEEQAVQKLAADAPTVIRGDVQTLVQYEIALSQHKTSNSSAQHYSARRRTSRSGCKPTARRCFTS